MGINTLIEDAIGIAKENPITTALGVGAAGVALGAGTAVAIGAMGSSNKSKRKKRSKIKHTRRGWKLDRAKRSKQKWEVAYRKRKRKAKKSKSRHKRSGRIHYARKTGQPYIILKNGRAKFIKGRRKK
jgi:hypothetical protein